MGVYFDSDHLITLHQRKQNLLKNHILRSKIMLGFDRESDFEQAIITALQSNGWDKEVIHHPTEATVNPKLGGYPLR
ncbi:MAG: hypothetical protein V8S58_13510 [Lachnospiraceae bacterium]